MCVCGYEFFGYICVCCPSKLLRVTIKQSPPPTITIDMQ